MSKPSKDVLEPSSDGDNAERTGNAAISLASDKYALVNKDVLKAHSEAMDRLATSIKCAFDTPDFTASRWSANSAGLSVAGSFNGAVPAIYVHLELSKCLGDPSLQGTDPISKYDVNGPNSAPPFIAGRVQAWPPFAYYHIQLFPADFLTMSQMQNVADRIALRLQSAGARVFP